MARSVRIIPSPYAIEKWRSDGGVGPERLLHLGLADALSRHYIDVHVSERAPIQYRSESTRAQLAEHLLELRDLVGAALDAGELPLVLAGDCLAGLAVTAALQQRGTDFEIAYADAHGDFNTDETTLSGYLPGMPLAAACGRGLELLRQRLGCIAVEPQRISLLGVRDLDPAEKAVLDALPVQRFAPDHLPAFAPKAHPTYLHFDLDALDPLIAPGVSHPAHSGLTLDQACNLAAAVKPHLTAMTLSTYVPRRDASDNRTAHAAIAVILAALS